VRITDKPPQGRFSGLRIGFSTANGPEPLRANPRISRQAECFRTAYVTGRRIV
jgi:hypothetical protein